MSKGLWGEAQQTLSLVPADAPLSERERAYVTGLDHMLQGQYPAAIDTFLALLERSPYDVEAQHFQTDQALKVLDALAVQEPENHHVWAAMGYMAMSLGDDARAQQALARYADIAPELPHPWQLLGTLAMHQQRLDDAVDAFGKALAAEPDFTPAILGRARAKAYLGQYEPAQATLQALAEDPDTDAKYRISAALDRAGLLQAEQRFSAVDPALAVVEGLVAEERGRVSLVLTERAYAAIASNELDKAEQLISDAIANAPPEGVPTRYLFARGLLELRREEYESIPVTVAAIRKHALPQDDPDQTEERAALLLEGRALAQQGDFKQSVKLLTKALTLLGYEYRLVSLALAEAYRGLGDRGAALASSMQALSERPQFQEAEPRLDLELERRNAFVLAAGLSCELGDPSAGARLRKLAVEAWQVPLECNGSRR
jgi:tetratricopeptide (TPR) repeat protein